MIKEILYQRKAVDELLKKVDNCIEEGEKEFLFVAPTGSGKTIMTGLFMIEYLEKHKDEKIGYFWLSPGKGDLAGQSKGSISETFNQLNTLNLSDVLNQGEILPNDAVFINWEAINKKDNVATREGEKSNLFDVIESSDLDKFIVLVDESHESRNSIKANELLDAFSPDIIIDITATPRESRIYNRFNTVKIDINDVIEEGFIKNQIVINEGLDNLDLESVLKASIEKRKEVEVEYRKIEPNCPTPLILIQIENDNKIELDGGKIPKALYIKNELEKLGVKDNKIAIWVSDKNVCQNLDDLKTSDVEVLIFKSAIATGYDIPRSSILCRLREIKSSVFDTQVLGRVLRTVYKKHYGVPLIDSAYIFTEFSDYEYKLELDEDLLDRVKEGKKQAFLKEEFGLSFPKFSIPMEKKETQLEHSVDTGMLKVRLDRELLHRVDDFIIQEDKLKESLVSGKVDSNKILELDALSNLEGKEVNYSDKKIKELYVKKTKGINKKLVITKMLLNILRKNKDVRLPIDAMKLYLSNENDINLLIDKAIKDYYEVHLRKTVVIKDYTPPMDVYYNNVLDDCANNYAYSLQPNLDVKYSKSSSEDKFSQFLENSDKVKYWYKNGVGSEHFSINYRASDYTNKLYFPDFIVVGKDNKLYILDTKSPILTGTMSDNKDFKDIESKYFEGKEYESKYRAGIISKTDFSDIEFSMIKFNSDEPYICLSHVYNTDYSDNIKWGKFLG